MSNELSTPKILLCPSDTGKLSPAASFQIGYAGFNGFVSYIINGDVTADNDPQMILSSDSNIAASLTGQSPLPNAVAYINGAAWVWLQNSMHMGTGNLLLADGSVQSASQGALRTYLMNGTNSVLGGCPVYNFFPAGQ